MGFENQNFNEGIILKGILKQRERARTELIWVRIGKNWQVLLVPYKA